MIGQFELFVAARYLRAKRKQAVISVITLISVVGVAAGVMALIVALSINNGFRGTLQRNLLGATAHVAVLEKQPGEGIEQWDELSARIRKLPNVTGVAPSLYAPVMVAGPPTAQAPGAILKGVDPDAAAEQFEMLLRLKQGSLDRLKDTSGLPGIILGSELAAQSGMMLNSVVQIIVPAGEITPFGPRPVNYQFRVVGIFESGFFELDARWAYTTLQSAQRILGVPDVVNSIEVRVQDIYRARETAQEIEKVAGPKLAAADWMEMNKPILSALNMEKTVTVITIGLIQMVSALNILIALIMGVMEKYKDIAILVSMGARSRQIRNIFMLQGVLIGVVGSVLGLLAGYAVSFLANKYQWVPLDREVYSLAYVPFDPRPIDGLWVAAVAIAVSFVATIYPARNASKIVPVEALRYE